MDYPISKEEKAPHTSFVEHFEDGIIDVSYDWNDVMGRVRRLPCREIVAGTEAEPCEKMHAALG